MREKVESPILQVWMKLKLREGSMTKYRPLVVKATLHRFCYLQLRVRWYMRMQHWRLLRFSCLRQTWLYRR